MDNDETYLTQQQQQQVDISGFVASAISAVVLIVLAVWVLGTIRSERNKH